MYSLNETHDPNLECWVESASRPDTEFPIQNLPLGVFCLPDAEPRIGCAIGDQILDLHACADLGLIKSCAAGSCRSTNLNWMMALKPADWSALRLEISRLLRKN